MTNWSKVAKRIRVPLGFAFAVFYFWLASPTWTSILWGSLAVAAGLTIRAFASGHVQKNEQLTTSGPYAYVRNPLYTGSVILGFGFAIAARTVWVYVAMVVLFLGIYLPVVVSEENFLRDRFPEFSDYSRHVPRFLPRLHPFRGTSSGTFSSELYWKHREYNALLGSIGVVLVLIIKLWYLR